MLAFPWGEPDVVTREPTDQRTGERLEHPVLVAYQSVDHFLSDFGTNLSSGGVFVNTRDPLPVGTRVRLLISLPDRDPPVPLVGQVVRVQPPGEAQDPGMGIEFVDTDPGTQARLEAWVQGLRADLAGSGEAD